MSHILATYKQFDTEFVRGDGPFLWDADETRYTDLTSGIAVCNLGHCYGPVSEALKTQADRLWHTSNLYPNSLQQEAARKISLATGMDRVFFANSGAEANEGLFKLARRHGNRRLGGRTTILTLSQSFHGRTMAGIALTGQEKVRNDFGPLMPGVAHCAPNDLQDLEQAFRTHQPCALLIEPILAEGGGIVIRPEYVRKARELCDQYEALLLVDEVQTGCGRCGSFLASQDWDVSVDAVSLAKGLGNGFPVGAFAVASTNVELFDFGSHGSTFGGGYLASAVVNAVLDALDQSLMQQVQLLGETIVRPALEQWHADGLITDFVGKGLWWCFAPKVDAMDVEARCRDNGVLVLPTQGTKIRLLPPLNIETNVLGQALEVVSESLASNI